jgi:hypothetical protein
MKLSFGTQQMLSCVIERGRTQSTADTIVETLSAECNMQVLPHSFVCILKCMLAFACYVP